MSIDHGKRRSATNVEFRASESTLNPAQLRRINSVHRGFLFQHLVALGALLNAGKSKLKSLRPERDEDVELEFADKKIYVQVKFRSGSLEPSEISGVLARFAQLRDEHIRKVRIGKPEFVLYTNAELSQSLLKQVADWPSDTLVISANINTTSGDELPPAWHTLEEAVSWCVSTCGNLPFGSLRVPVRPTHGGSGLAAGW